MARTKTTTLLALTLGTIAPAIAQQNDLGGVHDPVLIKHADTYYLFSTGRGLPIRTSTDLKTWKRAGTAFQNVPAWAKAIVPTATDFWAPDIVRVGNEYRLYYAVSKFGTSQSVIGLATNVTLDPADPKYEWVERGLVVETKPGQGWNAIDAAAFVDDDGQHWLSLGSFWSGLKLFKLDAAGKIVAGDKPRSIAARPGNTAIEAPFVSRRDGWYYLWVSFDQCCKGSESTYNTRVGRSRNPDGPYADRDGRPMMDGGGTVVVQSEGDVRGPGHNAIFSENGTDYLVHHWYDAARNGRRTLAVRPLTWDADGWPTAGEMLAKPTGPTSRSTTRPAAP